MRRLSRFRVPATPAVCLSALLLACCAWADRPDHPIDRQWFRTTAVDEVNRWRAAAFTPSGFFLCSLDREWRPVDRRPATLVSQTRLIFVMAAGWELTGEPAFLDAARKGSDFLLAHFRDGELGGWFQSVSPEGKVIDDSKNSYGHAFAIFALSHAARLTQDERCRAAALETWSLMQKRFRDPHGFFVWQKNRDFTEARGRNTQNPMMHLFEALLALHDATGSPQVLRDAQSLADAIFGKLFDARGGYLPEWYDADWKPLPVEQKGCIDLGHQFEWAFLLSHAVEKGLPRRYLKTGERLLGYGMKVAYDRENGGIHSRGDFQGGFFKEPKGWWQQAEFLRALMHYAVLRRRDDLWEPFRRSLEFVQRRFIDPEHGGWFASHDPARPREGRQTHKATPWMVGYHVTGMYWEALRLAQCSVPPL